VRIVALEEHFLFPDLVERLGDRAGNMTWLNPVTSEALADVGLRRLADMDAHGIDVQVLSASMPGAELLDGPAGVAFAVAANDRLAKAVAEHPNRFAGFAHLPMQSPIAAADELERAVLELGFRGAMINGMSSGVFLDDPRILNRHFPAGKGHQARPELPVLVVQGSSLERTYLGRHRRGLYTARASPESP